jgi:hypothetical protein
MTLIAINNIGIVSHRLIAKDKETSVFKFTTSFYSDTNHKCFINCYPDAKVISGLA